MIRNIGSMVASRLYLQRIWIPLRVSSQRIFIDNPPEICAPNSSARKPEQGFTMTEEVRDTCVWLTFKLSHSNNWTIVLLIIKVLTEFPFSLLHQFLSKNAPSCIFARLALLDWKGSMNESGSLLGRATVLGPRYRVITVGRCWYLTPISSRN